MLSYRHAFHAGNSADVLKHLVLAKTIEYMLLKPAPILYIDTHSGAGQYSLMDEMANKTGEYRQGVMALDFDAFPNAINSYQHLIEPLLLSRQYPGSPVIAAQLLREQDSLRLFELHTSDCAQLDALFRSDRRVKVHKSDGYQSLKALLPPQQKRALVMIDPSYEIKRDYELVVAGLNQAYQRMPHAQYLIWYPVVKRTRTEKMIRALCETGMRDIWRFELGINQDNDDYGMTASGVVAVNPPWTLANQMRELLPVLQNQLSSKEGFFRIEQLVSE